MIIKDKNKIIFWNTPESETGKLNKSASVLLNYYLHYRSVELLISESRTYTA